MYSNEGWGPGIAPGKISRGNIPKNVGKCSFAEQNVLAFTIGFCAKEKQALQSDSIEY